MQRNRSLLKLAVPARRATIATPSSHHLLRPRMPPLPQAWQFKHQPFAGSMAQRPSILLLQAAARQMDAQTQTTQGAGQKK
jgi:predicted component of type VI protein secretion system